MRNLKQENGAGHSFRSTLQVHPSGERETEPSLGFRLAEEIDEASPVFSLLLTRWVPDYHHLLGVLDSGPVLASPRWT